jgi:hypothetical protein
MEGTLKSRYSRAKTSTSCRIFLVLAGVVPVVSRFDAFKQAGKFVAFCPRLSGVSKLTSFGDPKTDVADRSTMKTESGMPQKIECVLRTHRRSCASCVRQEWEVLRLVAVQLCRDSEGAEEFSHQAIRLLPSAFRYSAPANDLQCPADPPEWCPDVVLLNLVPAPVSRTTACCSRVTLFAALLLKFQQGFPRLLFYLAPRQDF